MSRLFGGLFSGLTYKEVIQTPGLLLKPASLKRLILFAGHAELTRDWLVRWMRKLEIEPRDCLFYTYWFNEVTLGVGLARSIWPDMRLVSRAHRYDLYEEVNTPPYWPCRESTVHGLTAYSRFLRMGQRTCGGIILASSSKIRISRLGMQSPGLYTQASSDGIYRIVSCSKLVPVKRVELLMQGIAAAAERRPRKSSIGTI